MKAKISLAIATTLAMSAHNSAKTGANFTMKTNQAHMFPRGDDLPLFSQTPQRGHQPPFIPEPTPTTPPQAELFILTRDEAQATERFKCPYCEYECDMSELGGDWDCPCCGDN